MAKNDIYNSKILYENLKEKILNGGYCKPGKTTIYTIKNPKNIEHFKKLIKELEYKDISYIRRIGYLKALKKVCHYTKKNLKDLSQDDVKDIINELNKVHKKITSRRDFVYYNRFIWKKLFPETDSKGRPDDKIIPYAWSVEIHADKSQQEDKKDKFTQEEYSKIMNALNKDPRMQCFFSLLYESLARPQELCYLNVGDIELLDNYARLRVRSHGKEGPKTLQIIDGYYYLAEWLNKHPQKHNKEAALFVTLSRNSKTHRMTLHYANVLLGQTRKKLGIDKPITCYSFKRNGVTHQYIAGAPAQSIQKKAGWTSTKQLKTYDLSDQIDFLDQELIKRGIIKEEQQGQKIKVTFQQCAMCNAINPQGLEFCSQCKRPLDRNRLLEEGAKKDQEIKNMKDTIENMQETIKLLSSKMSRMEKLKFWSDHSTMEELQAIVDRRGIKTEDERRSKLKKGS